MVSCYYSTAQNMYSRYHHHPTGSESPPGHASSAQAMAAAAAAAAHQFQTHHHGGSGSGHHPQVGAGPPPMPAWYPAPPTAGYHHTLHHQTAGTSPHHTHYSTMAQAYSPGNEDQLVHPFFHHAAGQFAAASASYHHGTVALSSSSLDGGNASAQQAVEYGNHGSPAVTVSGGSEMSSPGGASTGAVITSSVEANLRGTPLSNTQQSTVSCRPTPARSPYEWIKKTSYQTQPNPALDCLCPCSDSVLLDIAGAQDSIIGKTRTKDKYRVVYSDHQRVELEKEFYYSRYITIRRKAELARELGLSERQVKIWFQNRRAKERKQVKKREEFNGVVQSRRSSPSMTAALVVNRDPLAIHGLTTQQHQILHGSATSNQGPVTAQMGQSLLINGVEGMTLM